LLYGRLSPAAISAHETYLKFCSAFGSVFSSLLDESKDETFDKFDNLADQIARDYDEYELETESAGPVFQLVGRVAF
jgi:hypothetical protein